VVEKDLLEDIQHLKLRCFVLQLCKTKGKWANLWMIRVVLASSQVYSLTKPTENVLVSKQDIHGSIRRKGMLSTM
jgi:hypothetical protein